MTPTHTIYVPHFQFPFICWRTFRLFSLSSNCEWYRNEQGWASICGERMTFSGICQGAVLVGDTVDLFLGFFFLILSVLISRVTAPIFTPHNRVPLYPKPYQQLLSAALLILVILTEMRWNVKVVLICNSLIAKDGEQLLMYSVTFFIISFENSLFRSLDHFLIDPFVFSVLCFVSALHSLDSNLLSDMYLVMIISHSLSFLCSRLIASLYVQKLFSFLSSHLSVVGLNLWVNGVFFRKPFPTLKSCRLLPIICF